MGVKFGLTPILRLTGKKRGREYMNPRKWKPEREVTGWCR